MDVNAPFRWLPLAQRLALAAGIVGIAAASPALTLQFPGEATVTANRQDALTSYRLPIGPWTDAGQDTRLVEGALDQTAWRVATPGLSTLALMKPLRQQLINDGWTILFECETNACGGYDFRYSTEVMLEPDMHVDLGDFRYLAAEKEDQVLSLLVSRSATSGFVQLMRMGTAQPDAPEVTTSTNGPTVGSQSPILQPKPDSSLARRLETGGALPLDDLVFDSGASTLAKGEYPSLADLAAYLLANPNRTIALVGHTDASGGLDGNIALSRKRAQSVRQRLISEYGLPGNQITADGVGFLSPRASNLTPEGRTQNRRVEVMLTSTQ